MQAQILSQFSEEKVVQISEARDEPRWLLDYRLAAYRKFRDAPIEKHVLFTKYADFLRGVDLSGVWPVTSPQKLHTSEKDITILQKDGALARINLPEWLVGKIIIAEIGDAVNQYPDLIRPHFVTTANGTGDKFTHLNDAFFSSGLFISIPKGLEIKDTLRRTIYQELSRIGTFEKTVISMDETSRLSLLTEFRSGGSSTNEISVLGSSTEIFLGSDAKLSYSEIQLLGNNVVALLNKRIIGGADSHGELSSGYLGGRVTRSVTEMTLQGPGSHLEDLEIVVGSGEERFDLGTIITHKGVHTKGIVDVKAVMKDRSSMTLKGMNKIEEQARNSDTFLGGHAILLGNGARANVIPGLEIDTREVKAKHSAAVAQIDPDQIFYLRSRGLDEDSAIQLIVAGFLEPIVSRFQSEDLQEQLREVIRRKWAGEEVLNFQNEDPVGVAQNGMIFEKVAEISDLPEGKLLGVDVGKKHLLLSNIGGTIYATGGLCTHEVTDLARGFLGGNTVTCPLHLSEFDLKTGEALNPPATDPLKIYPVKVEGNEVFVAVS